MKLKWIIFGALTLTFGWWLLQPLPWSWWEMLTNPFCWSIAIVKEAFAPFAFLWITGGAVSVAYGTLADYLSNGGKKRK